MILKWEEYKWYLTIFKVKFNNNKMIMCFNIKMIKEENIVSIQSQMIMN
jgi:hypothetical protein